MIFEKIFSIHFDCFFIMKKNVNTSHKPLFRYRFPHAVAGYFFAPERRLSQAGFCFGLVVPWLLTPSAFIICLTSLMILFSISVFLSIRSANRLKANLASEKAEREKEKTLGRLNTDSLLNVFHEFRTPSTLIATQTELLINNYELTPDVLNAINKIRRQNLVIQSILKETMRINSKADNLLKIIILRTNLTSFLQDTISTFNDFAGQHNIEIGFERPDDSFEIWFDNGQIKKVIHNILYNLIKHANGNDNITVAVVPRLNSVIIKISAQREIIPSEKLACIFEQQHNDDEFPLHDETDINLAISKYFIELHKGKIEAGNRKGKGTEFSIELLRGESHFTEEQKKAPLLFRPYVEPETDDGSTKPLLDTPPYNEAKPSVLVVEYNQDLVSFFIGLFSPLYNVETAESGEEGLEKMENHRIDLAICDVNVPRINGFDFCRKVKTKYDWAHIPVILLSTSDDSRRITKGFQAGADEFVVKPFDSALLLMRCNNLVANRCKLQEIFSSSAKFNSAMPASSSADIRFLEKINAIVEHNIDSNHFNVDDLAKEINIGRSKLYTMVKDVTGLTPNNYILTFKLEKAAGFIKENRRFLVSELAYGLGFSSPKYFSQCFKEHFGLTPKEFNAKFKDKQVCQNEI